MDDLAAAVAFRYLSESCGIAFDAGRRIAELEAALVKEAVERESLEVERKTIADELGDRIARLDSAKNYPAAKALIRFREALQAKGVRLG